jgi:hypothetical protein
VIFYCSIGDESRALFSAEKLAAEARVVRNIRLACAGLRNAAEALNAFGRSSGAQALLHEAHSLALTLDYPIESAILTLKLADLAIEQLDLDGARSYLHAAEHTIREHELTLPVLVADLHFHTCWEAVLGGDNALALKASRALARTVRGAQGTARSAVLCTRLATHQGRVTADLLRDAEDLRELILKQPRGLNEQHSLAALLLFSQASNSHHELAVFAMSRANELAATPSAVRPFLQHLMASR